MRVNNCISNETSTICYFEIFIYKLQLSHGHTQFLTTRPLLNSFEFLWIIDFTYPDSGSLVHFNHSCLRVIIKFWEVLELIKTQWCILKKVVCYFVNFYVLLQYNNCHYTNNTKCWWEYRNQSYIWQFNKTNQGE